MLKRTGFLKKAAGSAPICRAADVSAIGSGGGAVELRITAELAGYGAITRSRVAAQSWGAFAKSFRFGG